MGSAKKKQAHVATDREKWGVIFNALKLMLRKQHSQIETLLEQRSLLEQRIKMLHERWVSDVRLSEGQISQLRRQLALAEIAKLVEVSKADLFNGSKEREALVYKHKLEQAESELHDFKAWFDILSHRCPDQEDISPNKLYESLKETGGKDSSSKGVSTRHCKTLENEVAMLKREYEKLSVKCSSEKSALQAEINFVWNQYKEMESKYTDQLRTKSDEVDKANEKIMKLIGSLEQLQSSNTEKDEKVDTLTASITKLEAEVSKKDGEISKLQKELESVRSRSTSDEPVLKHRGPSSSNLKTRRSSRNKGHEAPEEQACFEQLEATNATLRGRITKLEAETKEKNGEISKLSKELESLRCASPSGEPLLKHCGPSSSNMKTRRSSRNKGHVTPEEQASVEQPESTNKTLRERIAKLEAETREKNGEISKLSKELQLLRSKSVADTPVLKRCRDEPSSSRLRGTRNVDNKGGVASSAEMAHEQGSRRSKRKQSDMATDDGTPKLFTSQFKIPKLKTQSPHGR